MTEWSDKLNAFWRGANGCEYIAYRGSHHIFVYDCDTYPSPPIAVWQFTRVIDSLEDFEEALENSVKYKAVYVNDRDVKIQFIIDSMWHLEDVTVGEGAFENYSDKELDEEVEWYEYLWTK